MCGRITSTKAAPLIDAIEAAQVSDGEVAAVLAHAPGMPAGLTSWWAPRANVAPTQPIRVVIAGPRLTLARWGLTGSGPSAGRPIINARAETAGASPLFRGPLARRRCLVVADAFYEWRGAARARSPVRIGPDADAPAITLGAIARRWRHGDDLIDEVAILTTAASPLVAPIHDRQPVVIHAGDRARWLDAELPLDAVRPLLEPDPLLGWTAVPAPSWLNSARIERAAAPPT